MSTPRSERASENARGLVLQVPTEWLDVVAERAAEIVLERLAVAPSSSPYFSVEEAAEYLRCDRQRIYDLVSSRRLPKLKDGSRVLIRREDCDILVAPALPPGAQTRTGRRVAA